MQPVPLPFFAYLPAELLSPVGKRSRPFFRKPDNRTIQVKIGLLSRIADGGRASLALSCWCKNLHRLSASAVERCSNGNASWVTVVSIEIRLPSYEGVQAVRGGEVFLGTIGFVGV